MAYDALVEYNRSPYDVDARALTFAEVYEKMLAERINSPKPPSRSTIDAYRVAFQHLTHLHSVRMADLRLDHLQGALDNSGLRYSMQVHVLNLMHQVYKYALKYDIVEKDYSHYAQINIENDNEKGVPFTDEFRKELAKLWERLAIPNTHTPHDCRHTFSWLCDKYGVDMFTKKLLMGHSLGTSVTENTYGHRNLEELRAEIEKICH